MYLTAIKEPFFLLSQDADLAAPTVENVRVVVRVRPMDQREKLDGSYNCVSVDSVNNTIAVTRNNVTPAEPPRVYAYDAVFESNTSQVCGWGS